MAPINKNKELPNPVWDIYFGYQDQKLVLTFHSVELAKKLAEFGFKKPVIGKLGTIGGHYIQHCAGNNDLLNEALELLQQRMGVYGFLSYSEILEQGFSHPMFLPNHGCFGFINDHLILANKHHMEIMFRLIEDKGWTWEQLVDAEQVWGWYNHDGQAGTSSFSSDAGIMTNDKVKDKCVKAFSQYFKMPWKKGGGYGGKNKQTYGGNIASKYGMPGEWGGSNLYVKSQNTIITALPDPPTK